MNEAEIRPILPEDDPAVETLAQMDRARDLYERFGFLPLEAPMGDTGHFGCNRWYALSL